MCACVCRCLHANARQQLECTAAPPRLLTAPAEAVAAGVGDAELGDCIKGKSGIQTQNVAVQIFIQDAACDEC